jgi:hypothetical protein
MLRRNMHISLNVLLSYPPCGLRVCWLYRRSLVLLYHMQWIWQSLGDIAVAGKIFGWEREWRVLYGWYYPPHSMKTEKELWFVGNLTDGSHPAIEYCLYLTPPVYSVLDGAEGRATGASRHGALRSIPGKSWNVNGESIRARSLVGIYVISVNAKPMHSNKFPFQCSSY